MFFILRRYKRDGMNILINFEDILVRIKEVLFKGEKVTNKRVAKELHIKEGSLAACVHRETIPYNNIIMWCLKNRIDVQWVLTGIRVIK